MDAGDDVKVRIVTIIVLGAAVVAAVIGLTFAAVLTDRDLLEPELMTLGAAVLVAFLGGMTPWWRHRRGRWRVEHEDINGR